MKKCALNLVLAMSLSGMVLSANAAGTYIFTDLGLGMASNNNDLGQVVGYSGTYVNPTAVFWNDAVQTTLSTPSGYSSYASGINIWNGTTPTILDSLGGAWSGEFSINDSGQIVGYGTNSLGQTNAFILSAVAPVPEPETYAMMLLGIGMLGFMARRKNNSAA